MPTFKLSDKFSFSTDIEAGPGALSRYFKSLPGWAALPISLKQLKDTSWDDPAVVSSHNLLCFDAPVNLGTEAVTLNIAAGVNGTLSIVVPLSDNDPLFTPDMFGDNIPVRLNERYVSASLQSTLAVAVSAPVDKLTFGFDGKSAINLTYCRPFGLDPETPVVLDSIKQTLADFAIPGDIHDIAAMPDGSVAAVDSSGTLKFSGSVNLLTFTNPLASVTLPAVGDLQITAGGSITVGAAYEYSGGYQVRVQKLPGAKCRIGFYRRRESEFSVTATASACITNSLDSSLFQTVLGAISAQPQVDQNELAAAGLPPERITQIQTALQSSIDRTLSLGVTMEAHDSTENDAMFLYEVDLTALASDPSAAGALNSALRGNLSDLIAREHNPGSGIRMVKSLIGTTKTLKHVFKINLLGIYNQLNLSSMIRKGTVAWDATTGEYILTDSVNASRLGIDTVNFGANSDKLRNLLAESFLATAAYRAGACVETQPSLQARQSFFALSARTNPDQLQHDLMLGAGLGFLAAQTAASTLPPLQDLGRTTLLAETSYDDAAFTALFLDNGQLRTSADYDRAGREALRYLTRPGDADDYRLRAANHDALWSAMREIGNVQATQFRQLFPDLPLTAIQVIGVDYTDIVWWTQSMQDFGQQLLALRQYLNHPGTPRTDPQFQQLKSALAAKLATLAGRTRQNFGGPWGLLAMSLAAPQAGRRFLLFNPNCTLRCETPLPALVTTQQKGAGS